jgi:hypothetical protein
MANVSIFGVFIVLIASFAISVYSARARASTFLPDFLFRGNTPLLGLSSCIGSIISMAVSFTALLSAGYEWGWQMILPMFAGCAVGLAAILKLTQHPRLDADNPSVPKDSFVSGASYLATLGSRSTMPYYGFSISAYGAMLITEIVVLRGFIGSLTELPPGELLLTIATVLIVCYGYVYIGGFRGVLVTDYFQLMVVFVFVGLWLASMSHRAAFHIPSPIAAHAGFTALTRTLLYLGVFSGAFAWMFASVDQWYRTIGTLPLQTARRVLISSAIALSAFSIVPVLAGAAAVGRPDIPARITNSVSLILIGDLLTHANTTVRFVFAMALTCAALTTLNTYLMTMQQLYYEAETRIDSRGWLRYMLVKYPFKWQQVRGFVAILGAIAFILSCMFPAPYVYAFGVAALSTFILMLPFVTGALAEIFEASRNRVICFAARAIAEAVMGHGGVTVFMSVIVWVALLAIGHATLGSLSIHLYVIPAAAFGAATTATTIAVAVRAFVGPQKEAA